MPQLSIAERLELARKSERWTQVYRESPETFSAFERAEDPEGLAAERLAELAGVAGARVLEIGCGTGWLTRVVAPLARVHVAVEPQRHMLRRAGDMRPAHVVRARGEFLPVAADQFDCVVMSWVLLDLRPELRHAVLAECDRVLSQQGEPGVWLIENAGAGAFQELRGIEDNEGPGEMRPLLDEHGFQHVETVEAEFRFADAQEAEHVLGTILGESARDKLRSHPRAHIPLELAILFRPSRPGGAQNS